MDALPNFDVIRPTTLADVMEARKAHPDSRMLGGGTDLMVNVRRGIESPPVLIDTNDLEELRAISVAGTDLTIGASARLHEVANNADVLSQFPAVAQAAGSIAGPSHRNMGTVGGNICLDTRCIFYNQSEWWRDANDNCLKTVGTKCHVAPKSDGVCFATFSGDLAPALLVFGGTLDLAGPEGERSISMTDFYTGYAKQDGSTGDGKNYMAIKPGEIVVRVRAENTNNLISAYDKIRIRRSIEYPVAGCAVALKREGDSITELRVAFTGTNPRPVLLDGTAALCGSAPDDAMMIGLDDLCKDQLMSMKTTFTPGHYRRRVATQMAKRLVKRLYAEAA
jgi:4-hydroxybenzoyl-CoA reductase subunit beta